MSTSHAEFTVTLDCGLISAGMPCQGCSTAYVQDRDSFKPEINADRAICVIEREIEEGINLFTLMGGEPTTVKGIHRIIQYIADSCTTDALIYTASYGMVTDEGQLTERFFSLDAAGLSNLYLLASVDRLVLDKQKIPRGDSSSFKSFFGLKLMEVLATEGRKDIGIHQTLKSDNLDDTLKLYKWARERNVLFSCCPLVWRPYVRRRRSRAVLTDFPNRLMEANKPKLMEIIKYFITIETERLRGRKSRTLVPSSAFLRLIPDFGLGNVLSCREHRNMARPMSGRDITPNGENRWCIAQNTYDDGFSCGGCHYIGIDRGTPGEYWAFEGLAGRLRSSDIRWQNYIVCRKTPDFVSSRRNLVFHQGVTDD